MLPNVGVVGTRTFGNYEFLEQELDRMFPRGMNLIVTGDAKGADSLAIRYAKNHCIPFLKLDANWDEYGKAAGSLRNREIVIHSDHVVAFWDGKSPGTQNTIQLSKGKCTVIVY